MLETENRDFGKKRSDRKPSDDIGGDEIDKKEVKMTNKEELVIRIAVVAAKWVIEFFADKANEKREIKNASSGDTKEKSESNESDGDSA